MQQGGHRPGDPADQVNALQGSHARSSLNLLPHLGTQSIEAESIGGHQEVAVSAYPVDLTGACLGSPWYVKIRKTKIWTEFVDIGAPRVTAPDVEDNDLG